MTTLERPDIKGGQPARIRSIPESDIPGGSSDPEKQKRLVFVGDIHGCLNELNTLLEEVAFNRTHDILVHTGDVVGKGPDSPGVIDKLIFLNALGVRGNWDDYILAGPSFSTGKKKKDAAVARTRVELQQRHLDYLRSLPHMISIKKVPWFDGSDSFSEGEKHVTQLPIRKARTQRLSPLRLPGALVVAHAGVVPGIDLDDQDADEVTHMRYLDRLTLRTSSDERIDPHWTDVWDEYQSWRAKSSSDATVAKEATRNKEQSRTSSATPSDIERESSREVARLSQEPKFVVYGHHSKDGVRIGRWHIGLDGGCVKGGELVGLVLDAWGGRELVRVPSPGYLD